MAKAKSFTDLEKLDIPEIAKPVSPRDDEYVCKDCNRRLRFSTHDFVPEEEIEKFRNYAQNPHINSSFAESFVVIPKKEKPPRRAVYKVRENEIRDPATVSKLAKLDIGSNLNEGFKTEMETFKKLMDIASLSVDCRNPLCEACFTRVEKHLEKQIANVQNDILKFDDAMKQHDEHFKLLESQDNLNEDVPEVNKASDDLEQELLLIMQERQQLEKQMRDFGEAEKVLSFLEEKFLLESNQFWQEIRVLDSEHARVRQRIRGVSEQLEMMKRTNVYDDAFHIYYDGHFGTISGLRLGRLDGQNVEWEEINAGLGQAMLLLDVLAGRTDFQFQRYRLYPMGSASKIKDIKRNAEHEFYGLNGLFGRRGLDQALPCFLDCIQQLTDYAIRFDSNFSPKYTINTKEGKIGIKETNNMVRIQPSQSGLEDWTRALKYMLTNMKFLLAWVARYYPI